MKRHIISLSLAAATLVGTSAYASEQHFGHLMFRETPYAPYVGIYPLSEKASGEVSHYEFEYDKQGRLVRISQEHNEQLVPAHGRFDSFIWFAPEVRIAYQGNQEVHTYFNTEGEQMYAHGQVWRAVYTLNDEGERTKLEFFNQNGEPSESEWNIAQYEWRPSDDGHVFEKRFNLAGEQQPIRPWFHFHEVKLEYDNRGMLAFMRNYGTDNKPTNNDSGAGIDRITYDLSGNFIRWQVYDKDGNPVEGNRPMVHLGEHLYDDMGNKVGMRGYDRFGNQMAFAWGAFEEKNEYNKQGIAVSQATYRMDGELESKLVIDFSSDLKHRTSIMSLDQDGKLKGDPRLRGAARVAFEYSDDGQRQVKFFDADGQEIENNNQSSGN